MQTTINLTSRIYTREAIQQTIEEFAHLCSASFTPDGEVYVLRLTAPRQLTDDFLNYVLGLSAQQRLW